MNETILTSIDKQAFLETLETDPEWAFEVLNRLLKHKERAETFREWLGINELARAVRDLAEAQQRTEQQVQVLAEAQRRTEQQVQTLTHRVDMLAEAQQRTEQQVQTLAHRVDMLAEVQQRTEQQVQVLAEAQQRTEQQVRVLAHHVGVLSEILGPTWEEEARESVAFLLPKAGVRLLTPFEAQLENEWDGVAEAEWEGRSIQVRMEAKVSSSFFRIQNFAGRVRTFATVTGVEIMPIFCGMRIYGGAREEAQRQRIVLVGLREIRNEIPPSIFTIRPQDV